MANAELRLGATVTTSKTNEYQSQCIGISLSHCGYHCRAQRGNTHKLTDQTKPPTVDDLK